MTPRQASIDTTPHATWDKDDVLKVELAPWIPRGVSGAHQAIAQAAGSTRDDHPCRVYLDSGQEIDLQPWEVICNRGNFHDLMDSGRLC